MQIILLNGPPRSGKDTSAAHIRTLLGSRDYKLSKRLKEMAHGLYGVLAPVDDFGRRCIAPHDWFEAKKDAPLAEFRGLTPRQAYIAVSERYVKPVHGGDSLGRWLAGDLARDNPPVATVSDSGFRPELEALVRAFGAPSFLLVRLHPTTKGSRVANPFSGDSRGHVDLLDLGVTAVDVDSPLGDVPGLKRNLTAALARSAPVG